MENREIEIWKPIPDYEGLYEVSSWGNIKSLDRYKPSGGGGIHLHKGIVLKINYSGDYPQICLCKDNKKKIFRIHIIVDKVYYDSVDFEYIVNHKDLNKKNNYYKNLERINNRENQSHYFKNNFNKTSKYTGVSYDKSKPKYPWVASICHNKKSVKLGNFTNEDLAYDAYIAYLKDNNLENKYAKNQ